MLATWYLLVLFDAESALGAWRGCLCGLLFLAGYGAIAWSLWSMLGRHGLVLVGGVTVAVIAGVSFADVLKNQGHD